jgi:hypothetical protein
MIKFKPHRVIQWGIGSHKEYLGERDEVWEDGQVHRVSAWIGRDRRCWLRLSHPFGFRFLDITYTKGKGLRKVK